MQPYPVGNAYKCMQCKLRFTCVHLGTAVRDYRPSNNPGQTGAWMRRAVVSQTVEELPIFFLWPLYLPFVIGETKSAGVADTSGNGVSHI